MRENIKEHDENGKPLPAFSSLGIKFKFNGEWYGQVLYHPDPFLDVAEDMVHMTNILLESMVKAVDELGRTQDVYKKSN
jgi:hypothetical protein